MALADYASPIADEDNPLLAAGARPRRRDRHDATRPCAQARRWPTSTGSTPTSSSRTSRSASSSTSACALARDAVRLTGLSRVALAGGVVSNVKATRRIRLLPEVEDVYVFPHMGDGGLALGAAVVAAAQSRRADRSRLSVASTSGLVTTTPAIRGRAPRPPVSRPTPCANLAGRGRRPARRRADRDVVSGPDGIRPARARPSQRARASGSAGAAGPAEPRAQAARLVPAVLPEHARERGTTAARRLDRRPQPRHDDGVRGVARATAERLAA